MLVFVNATCTKRSNLSDLCGEYDGTGHQDVKNIRSWIHSKMSGIEEMVLTDEPGTASHLIPTRANITNALRWLVAGAAPGDRFFLHCESF
jgi:hypothetical protein